MPEVVKICDRIVQTDSRGTLLSDLVSFDMANVEDPQIESIDNLYKLNEEMFSLLREKLGSSSQSSTMHPFVSKLSSIREGGEKYQVDTPDANISFLHPGDAEGQWRAGRVVMLFDYFRRNSAGTRTKETFAVVQEYQPLSDAHAAQDAFRRYYEAGFLFYDQFRSRSILIFASQILCPCKVAKPMIAKRSFDDEVVLIEPINKVRN